MSNCALQARQCPNGRGRAGRQHLCRRHSLAATLAQPWCRSVLELPPRRALLYVPGKQRNQDACLLLHSTQGLTLGGGAHTPHNTTTATTHFLPSGSSEQEDKQNIHTRFPHPVCRRL